jgi:hypothetical protein
MGLAAWAAIIRPFALPRVAIPYRAQVAMIVMVLLAACVFGFATARMAMVKYPEPSDRKWIALSAPSRFVLIFMELALHPYVPRRLAFSLANGLLYAFYAMLALTPRKRWFLLGVPVLHAACYYALLFLMGLSVGPAPVKFWAD